MIAVFENIVSFGVDLWGWSRKKAVLVNLFIIALGSMPCILGFNVLSGIQPLGAGTNIMDLEDFLVSNNIQPLGSVIYLLFCTKRNGWGWKNFIQEANTGQGMKLTKKVRGYMTYILPWIVVIIYLKGYYDMFHNRGTGLFMTWMLIAAAFLLIIFGFASVKGSKNKESKNQKAKICSAFLDRRGGISYNRSIREKMWERL